MAGTVTEGTLEAAFRMLLCTALVQIAGVLLTASRGETRELIGCCLRQVPLPMFIAASQS